ncbi:MAG: hypothetical protein L3J71_12465 [Victivallaceae bacterium]|nr:hypothetical protein [Victivallaceae bacterium]
MNSELKNVLQGWFKVAVILFFICTADNLFALPAFPGAEGGGAKSVGGRGGTVYVVSNRNDSGAGSLRYGLEELTGPRTIVFSVGGYISLNSHIVISDDAYITIAGQTAPGDGITLEGIGSIHAPLIFTDCHDIVIRYIRIRKGGTGATGQSGDALSFSGNCYNIMIDHCSLSWSNDENIGCWSVDGISQKNITLQWSISSEGLNYAHPGCGFIAGSDYDADNTHNISVHHNMFANNYNRNPLLKIASGDITNNIIYNWDWWSTGIGGGIEVDIIGNKYKAGPDSGSRREVLFKPHDGTQKTGPSGNPSILFEKNIGPHNSNPAVDAWGLMLEMTGVTTWGYPLVNGIPTLTDVPTSYRRADRRALTYPISEASATDLETLLLSSGGIGACRRLDENGDWVANRDSVDSRVISEYFNNTGMLPDIVDDFGGWSVYVNGSYSLVYESIFALGGYNLNSGTPYIDSDSDGMPDVWEDNYSLDKNNNNDAVMDADNDGYDNLEEFLNGTNPVVGAEYVYVHLDLDQATGTQADDLSGNDLHGTLYNMDFSTDAVAGRFGSALDFNGVDERINFSDKLNIGLGDFTLMAWVYCNTAEDSGFMEIRSTAGYGAGRVRFGIDSNGMLQYGIYSSSHGWNTKDGVGPGSTPLLNGWHHVAVTFDRDGYAKAYIDNVMHDDTLDISANADIAIGGTCYVGYDGWSAAGFFDGKIDEVKFFRRVLSVEEILVASGDAELYLKLDAVVGTAALDAMGKNSGAILKNSLSFNNDSVTGYKGNALDFDGSDDRLEAVDKANINDSNFTIAARIKFTGKPALGKSWGIVSVDHETGSPVRVRCSINDAGKLRYGLYSAADGWSECKLGVGADLSDGQWHYIVVTYDRSGYGSAYIDGIYVSGGTVNISDVTGDISGTVHVGYDKYGGPGYFNGIIDEVKIYKRQLQGTEIYQSRNN